MRIAGVDTRDVPVSEIARHWPRSSRIPTTSSARTPCATRVAFGLELQGVPRAEAVARAERVIERFGLPADEAPFSLSRGQRQMVALASVVVTEPAVIVLDEPTSGLDYRECMTVMETVREMAEQGSRVIMVCHDMEVVSDFAERLVVMADGCILARGATADVFADAALMARARVTPPQVVELSARLAQEVSPAFAHETEVSASSTPPSRSPAAPHPPPTPRRPSVLNVIDYVPGDTILHRLNPVTKLALAASIIAATFLADGYAALIGLLLLTLLLGAYAGSASRLFSLVKVLVPVSALMLVLQLAFVRHGEVLWLFITTDGLVSGTKACLRLVGVALPLVLMLTVTKTTDLANACVEKLHVPTL